MFRCDPKEPVENTLLKYAKAYEQTVTDGATYAESCEAHLRVLYSKTARRDVALLARGVGNRLGDGDLLEKLLNQFSRCLHVIYLWNGESLTRFLDGAFRELLHAVLTDHLQQPGIERNYRIMFSKRLCLRYWLGEMPNSRRKTSFSRSALLKPMSLAIVAIDLLVWVSSRLARSMRTWRMTVAMG